MQAPDASFVISVGSTNATKLEAVRSAFSLAFPSALLHIHGYSAPSGVSAQPMGDAETRQGASNRASAAQAAHAAAHGGATPHYSVGLEGGCGEEFGALVCFAWMSVLPSAGGAPSFSRTGTLVLPPAVAKLVRGGMELGDADDAVFGRVGSKHADGAVGLLTKGAITRASYYAHALVLALAPFISAAHYNGAGAAAE